VIDPAGKFLLAAGQNSHTVTVFAIDAETGKLSFTGQSLDVPSPVCIRFRPTR
jgi:6-phosphogluconolactonase